MKCKDFEERIYLYSELSEAERQSLEAHIKNCAACARLFQDFTSIRQHIAKVAALKSEPVNNARLTSNVMQAIGRQQKKTSVWFNSSVLKCAMVAASLTLIVLFGIEQMEPYELKKQIPVAHTVVLESTSISKNFLNRKQKSENKPSLYACVKSGGCDNVFIKNFVKKSF